MPSLFRRVADYFGFGQLWRVVLVEGDGTRRVLATHWSKDAAESDAHERRIDAFLDWAFDDIDTPGSFVAEKVK